MDINKASRQQQGKSSLNTNKTNELSEWGGYGVGTGLERGGYEVLYGVVWVNHTVNGMRIESRTRNTKPMLSNERQ